MKVQGRIDLIQVDPKDLSDHADVDHVADQIPEVGGNARVAAHKLFYRHRIGCNVGACDRLLDVVRIEESAAGQHRSEVAGKRSGIDRNDDLLLIAPRQVAILAHSDGVPGGQALDIGGEEVLPGNGNAHLEQSAQDGGVGGLAARAINGTNGYRKIVNNFIQFIYLVDHFFLPIIRKGVLQSPNFPQAFYVGR
jgi:hypothetical protein